MENILSLIKKAYSDSGINGIDKDLTKLQISEGLENLNMFIANLQSHNVNIPYSNEIDFVLESGKNTYIFDMSPFADIESQPISTLEYCQIFNGRWYPLTILNSADYYQRSRIDTSTGMPSEVLLQDGLNTSSLTFYISPSQNYKCRIKSLIPLPEFSIIDSITSLPLIYRRLLRFGLALELSAIYHGPEISPYFEEQYQSMLRTLQNNSPLILQPDKNPFFNHHSGRQLIQNGGYD